MACRSINSSLLFKLYNYNTVIGSQSSSYYLFDSKSVVTEGVMGMDTGNCTFDNQFGFIRYPKKSVV
jgi:hypothetical protein